MPLCAEGAGPYGNTAVPIQVSARRAEAPFHHLRGPPPPWMGEASVKEGHIKKAAAWPLLFSVFDCSNDFIDVFYVILIAPFFHFVHDAFHGGRVSQVGGAYLDGIRAGYHEFDGVFAGHNAA